MTPQQALAVLAARTCDCAQATGIEEPHAAHYVNCYFDLEALVVHARLMRFAGDFESWREDDRKGYNDLIELVCDLLAELGLEGSDEPVAAAGA